MSDPVRVSVVLAVHDRNGHDLDALQAVLASDLREIEVIVVDNGSADRAAELAAAVHDDRVKAVRLRPGAGTARSRNVGIARASAPYVALLEPDDLVRPDTLAATVSALDRNPLAGFAFTDFEHAGLGTGGSAITALPGFPTLVRTPLGGGWHLVRQPTLARALLYGNFIANSGVVLRRKVLTEIGPFDELTTHCSELDLWFRLAHGCDALYWDRVGHTHRQPLAAAGWDISGTRARDVITVLRREKERWSERSARTQLDRRIAQNIATLGYAERERRNRLRSAAMFAWAFATSPHIRWLPGILGVVRSQHASPNG
jgi:glycosyltransferase involved in cell wall biosynthesis